KPKARIAKFRRRKQRKLLLTCTILRIRVVLVEESSAHFDGEVFSLKLVPANESSGRLRVVIVAGLEFILQGRRLRAGACSLRSCCLAVIRRLLLSTQRRAEQNDQKR